MDQDETSRGGSPRPWPHCVLDEDLNSCPQRGTAAQFLAHDCCGHMAGRIKMPLGSYVGLGPGNIVLDGDQAPHERGTAASTFPPMSTVAKRLDESRCQLVRR